MINSTFTKTIYVVSENYNVINSNYNNLNFAHFTISNPGVVENLQITTERSTRYRPIRRKHCILDARTIEKLLKSFTFV